MMTMFGTLVQRLTSPVTSPTSSRRRLKSPSRWEIQSDPEDDCTSVPTIRKSRAKHLLDKRKSKSRARGLNVGEPMICTNTQNVAGWCDVNSIAGGFPLRGTKSLGRLDGFKEELYASQPSLKLDSTYSIPTQTRPAQPDLRRDRIIVRIGSNCNGSSSVYLLQTRLAQLLTLLMFSRTYIFPMNNLALDSNLSNS
ncbi:hypothetical protein KQX54_013331 [Cotesia glomerata]|uniref:Uncharacterized protein n=1 Tax=Cotesia glomerata TaxID=32391 RepID=A0AAV7INU7_COTGL|nr:hypothetical protein KQX54_013331 [Cotesia glomerata]